MVNFSQNAHPDWLSLEIDFMSQAGKKVPFMGTATHGKLPDEQERDYTGSHLKYHDQTKQCYKLMQV